MNRRRASWTPYVAVEDDALSLCRYGRVLVLGHATQPEIEVSRWSVPEWRDALLSDLAAWMATGAGLATAAMTLRAIGVL